MKRNRGFSYIEVLVVVAMLAVAVTIISSSISVMFGLNPRKSANELSSMISRCKIGAMSRAGDVYLVVSKDTSGITAYYYENDILKEERNLGKSSVSISYTDTATPANTIDVSGDYKLYISFNRATGGFSDLTTACSRAGGDATKIGTGFSETITITGGKTYVITLVPSTGKHYITAG